MMVTGAFSGPNEGESPRGTWYLSSEANTEIEKTKKRKKPAHR
jgi:hypothetical protein